jgi:hypothetical protein
MQPITVKVGPLTAASANNICLSQTKTGSGNLTLNGSLVSGGVAILDNPRQVLITNVGNDSGITFTVTGTTFSGQSVSETVTGTSGSTVATQTDFKTVTSISVSGSTSVSGVTVGTNGVAGSRWVRMDSWANAESALQVDVTGTVNYTVQTTMDDPNDPVSPVPVYSVKWVSSPDTNVVGQSATKASSLSVTPTWVRVLLNSGTGSVALKIAQFNVVNR